jgi:hypothetical protein
MHTLGYFYKKKLIVFAHENIKKLAIWQFAFFFSAALTAQNSLRMRIHNGNVSQDTSVL